jgi:hypothetical protein
MTCERRPASADHKFGLIPSPKWLLLPAHAFVATGASNAGQASNRRQTHSHPACVRQLPQQIVNPIRPNWSNVVRRGQELVDNAINAGASRTDIFTDRGGGGGSASPTWGVAKSLELIGAGPVVLIHTQNSEFNLKSPLV